ncbi:MAG TPA: uroporphyrinogen decarboxylase family protein [Candidatus Ratteibacteria bacterium]|nr:uroporphyrinogen decarboxylase family protein [bacterium]HOQ82037.1 uroporphyrinogen decarboxylase family protein [bacterium]HPC30192.1 uroporphyrinogen decarboxylase family protein [bacterium]HRS05969.1 uroporphyrinogen decarboxylase family protein [Candidatus Ratteibacteria bacterium]HRV04030.1 uroporphyrinogen decarboxylase family protein [Candidatus Ratteibacteria bacterium]
MTNRERVKSILHYEDYDKMPLVHFGFWTETLQLWASQGYIRKEIAENWGDGNSFDDEISKILGFDFDWYSVFHPKLGLLPAFENKIIEELPDGTKKILNGEGVITLYRPGAGSIPADVDHLLKDRKSWEQLYLPKLQWSPDRVFKADVRVNGGMVPFEKGGMEFLKSDKRQFHYGLYCGSLYGWVRNWLTMEGACYLLVDDEPLLDEIIETNAEICYKAVKTTLETGAKFDFGHFWEDICFKNGPLIAPDVFRKKIGPYYRKICDVLNKYGINIVSVDCDGCIDTLVPTWLENGVNTMFPIEVGTWGGSIKKWRQKYGKDIRGVGGVNKVVFSKDKGAVDEEIKRICELVEMGGYIPCPDHRIPPDAKWENVVYYCEQMRKYLT